MLPPPTVSFSSQLCPVELFHPISDRLYTYIEVGDTPVDLPPVTVGSGRRGSRWQAPVGDGACVPISPVDTASLDMDIHGVYADTLVALEGLLIG